MGEKYSERCPLAELAADLNPPPVLFNDAMDRREPEASAASQAFGREEGLENSLQIVRRDTTARVGNGKANESAAPGFGIVLCDLFIKSKQLRFQAKLAALWHR